MINPYLWHITLESGDTRRSPRSEVSQQVLATMAPHLRRALAAGRAGDPIPTTDSRLTATASGPNLVATVLSYDGVPLVTFGVASRSRGAGALWGALHEGRLTTTDRAELPAAPWCAARLEAGPEYLTDVSEWIGDYERIIAWAWIEGLAK